MAEVRQRIRRSSTEVRSLLYQAARDVFGELGYRRASTREIAQRAGVTEAMLFRHFGSKAQLFEEAVFDPFVQFMDQYIAQYLDVHRGDRPTSQLAYQYVTGIYALFVSHRDLLATMLSEHATPEQWGRPNVLDKQLDALTDQIVSFLATKESRANNVRQAVRFSMSMLLGVALADGHLFAVTPAGDASFDLASQMSSFLLTALDNDIA